MINALHSPQAAQYGALVLRVTLGVMFIAHGLLKIVVFTLPGTAQFFVGAGFPAWTAYAVTGAELIGGAMLLAGMYTRTVALGLIPILLGALLVHWPNGWVFSAQGGGWEYPLVLIMMSIVQALIGPGAYAWQSAPRAAVAAH